MIGAAVVADSISAPRRAFGLIPRKGVRLTTLVLTYPRFIHAEFMTHRVFSRNASSSRAIPVRKMIDMVVSEPAFFVHIGKNKPGMQANEEVDPNIAEKFKGEWRELAYVVGGYARRWSDDYGIHKQVVNRVLEPFMHITVIVTSTEWENFFELRDHPDAQPEIRELARTMKAAMRESTPKVLLPGEWHLPFILDEEREERWPDSILAARSAARCARGSYLNHDKRNPTFAEDIQLYERLVGADPIHASPTEHQARALPHTGWCKNFRGWQQFRDLIEQDGPDVDF